MIKMIVATESLFLILGCIGQDVHPEQQKQVQMCDESELIVSGTVMDVNSAGEGEVVVGAARRKVDIYNCRLAVYRPLKGDKAAGDTINVRYSSQGMILYKGESYLLFLRKEGGVYVMVDCLAGAMYSSPKEYKVDLSDGIARAVEREVIHAVKTLQLGRSGIAFEYLWDINSKQFVDNYEEILGRVEGAELKDCVQCFRLALNIRNGSIDALGSALTYVSGKGEGVDIDCWASHYLGEAIAGVTNKKAIPILRKHLRSKSAVVRWAASIAISKIGDDTCVSVLMLSLDDPDSSVIGHCHKALTRITGYAVSPRRSFPEDKVEIIKDWKEWWAGNRKEWEGGD